jgi:hypothetical protein
MDYIAIAVSASGVASSHEFGYFPTIAELEFAFACRNGNLDIVVYEANDFAMNGLSAIPQFEGFMDRRYRIAKRCTERA